MLDYNMLDYKNIIFNPPLKEKRGGFIVLLKPTNGRLVLPIRGEVIRLNKAYYSEEGFVIFFTEGGARQWISALPKEMKEMAVILPAIGNRIKMQGREHVDVLTDIPAFLAQILIPVSPEPPQGGRQGKRR